MEKRDFFSVYQLSHFLLLSSSCTFITGQYMSLSEFLPGLFPSIERGGERGNG